jgi:hypothetical protein
MRRTNAYTRCGEGSEKKEGSGRREWKKVEYYQRKVVVMKAEKAEEVEKDDTDCDDYSCTRITRTKLHTNQYQIEWEISWGALDLGGGVFYYNSDEKEEEGKAVEAAKEGGKDEGKERVGGSRK